MTQHTPGPWKAADRWGNFGDYNRHEHDAPLGQVSRFSFAVADAQGFVVAHCTGPLITMTSERSEANARLIAAAPELLGVLTRLVRRIEHGERITPDLNVMAAARAAVAKAEGRA